MKTTITVMVNISIKFIEGIGKGNPILFIWYNDHKNTGADKEDKSPPIEDFFVEIANSTQIISDIIKHGQQININIPEEVATPFPPLNFSQGENIWPKTTPIAAKEYKYANN